MIEKWFSSSLWKSHPQIGQNSTRTDTQQEGGSREYNNQACWSLADPNAFPTHETSAWSQRLKLLWGKLSPCIVAHWGKPLSWRPAGHWRPTAWYLWLQTNQGSFVRMRTGASPRLPIFSLKPSQERGHGSWPNGALDLEISPFI